jgi:hypothetical protein
MVRISLVPVLTPLYLYVSTFRSMCAVPNVTVFCSYLASWFPGILLTYFLNYFEMVPVAPIITGITFVFTFHMRCVSIVRSLCFRIFSAYFLITFLSPRNCNIYYYYYYYYYYWQYSPSQHSIALYRILLLNYALLFLLHLITIRSLSYRIFPSSRHYNKTKWRVSITRLLAML